MKYVLACFEGYGGTGVQAKAIKGYKGRLIDSMENNLASGRIDDMRFVVGLKMCVE